MTKLTLKMSKLNKQRADTFNAALRTAVYTRYRSENLGTALLDERFQCPDLVSNYSLAQTKKAAHTGQPSPTLASHLIVSSTTCNYILAHQTILVTLPKWLLKVTQGYCIKRPKFATTI